MNLEELTNFVPRLWDIPEARVKRPQTYNTIEWLETFGG